MNGYDKSNGKLKISESVLETITKLATLEVDGVSSLSDTNQGIAAIITKKYMEKPISIEVVDDVAHITVGINVSSKMFVPSIANKVQQNVKNSVQNMTSITVSSVNVYIAGIDGDEIESI